MTDTCGGCGGPHAFDTSVPSVLSRRMKINGYLVVIGIAALFGLVFWFVMTWITCGGLTCPPGVSQVP